MNRTGQKDREKTLTPQKSSYSKRFTKTKATQRQHESKRALINLTSPNTRNDRFYKQSMVSDESRKFTTQHDEGVYLKTQTSRNFDRQLPKEKSVTVTSDQVNKDRLNTNDTPNFSALGVNSNNLRATSKGSKDSLFEHS